MIYAYNIYNMYVFIYIYVYLCEESMLCANRLVWADWQMTYVSVQHVDMNAYSDTNERKQTNHFVNPAQDLDV